MDVEPHNNNSCESGECLNATNDVQPSASETSTVLSNLVEETNAKDIILQNSIQNQVEVVCNHMRIPVPVYNLHEVKLEHDFQLLRYHASFCSPLLARSMVSVGRFAKTEHDVKEDIAVQLMHHFLYATSRRIRDYNYYNI
ncbi:hypothetical protein RYX36_002460 [Vicia faba]